MPFAYYDRLSPARQRIYRRSDAIVELGLPPGVDAGATVARIRATLAVDDRTGLQASCQKLCDVLTAGFHVPGVRVNVLARRPSDDYGELHGLYEPGKGRSRACVSVWMRTAAKQQVVAFKSFLRTLIHEFCHHLDYELYAFEVTFHTEGFYKRESSLAGALFAQEPSPPAAG